MPRTRRRKGAKRVTRKKGGGKDKKVSGHVGVPNGSRFFSTRNSKGNPVLLSLTRELEHEISRQWKMFKNEDNIDTLHIDEGGKLVMKDADGVLKPVSVLYARGHGTLVKTIAGFPAIKCPRNIAVIQTGHGDYVDHSVFSALAPVMIKLLFGNRETSPTALDNFKNFLKLKSGYSTEYDKDALINSVSYKTPGSYLKNVNLTSSSPDDPFFDYRGVWDITDALKKNLIHYNDVTDNDYELNLDSENEGGSFKAIYNMVKSAIGGIVRSATGASRVDLKTPTKYENVWSLSSRMRGNTIFAGITTEEILDELPKMPQYKDHIIFLIVFACGAWDERLTLKERAEIKGLVGRENFGVLSSEGKGPATPFSLTPRVTSSIGSRTIISQVHGDPFGGTSIIAEEEDT
jgi:hypothetical protein